MLKTNKKKLLADLHMFEKHAYLKMDVRESNLFHDALRAHALEAEAYTKDNRIKDAIFVLEKCSPTGEAIKRAIELLNQTQTQQKE